MPTLFGDKPVGAIAPLAALPAASQPRPDATPPPPVATAARAAPQPEKERGGPTLLGLVPWALRGLGVVGGAGTLPPVLASLLLGGFVLTMLVQDWPPALPGQRKEHAITPGMAILADVGGLGAAVTGLVALGGVAVSLSLLALSFVVPS